MSREREHEDLEELDPLEEGAAAHVEELEELPPEAPAARAPRPGAPGGVRELERAPLVLRKAAWVLMVASLFPWFTTLGWVPSLLLAKVLILLGGGVRYYSVLHATGGTVPGPFQKIGGMHPRALDGLAFVLMLVGLAPVVDAGGELFAGLVEKGGLALALLTICSVLAYERGGKLNPVLGLTLPFAALAGLLRLVPAVGQLSNEEQMLNGVWAVIGSLGALAAGGIAGYTMVLALKEAKAHGEAKRRAALAARRGGGGGTARPSRR